MIRVSGVLRAQHRLGAHITAVHRLPRLPCHALHAWAHAWCAQPPAAVWREVVLFHEHDPRAAVACVARHTLQHEGVWAAIVALPMPAFLDVMEDADYWHVPSLYWRMLAHALLHVDAMPDADRRALAERFALAHAHKGEAWP